MLRRVIIWTALIAVPFVVSAGPTVPATKVVVPIDGAPAIGAAKAPVTIVEYTDFECPFCRRFHMTTWEALKRKYIDTGKVRYVSRDFPLPSHPRAVPAARIARCAAEQGRFWEMRHALFAEGVPADDRFLVELGFAQGLDPAKLGACMSNPRLDAGLRSDIEEARFLGVGGTPTFVFGRLRGATVEGEMVGGALSLAELEARLDALLAAKP
jgi:protein-disulfide isomerase